MDDCRTLPSEGRVRLPEFLAVLPFGRGTLYNRIKVGMAPPGRLDVNIRSWDVQEVRLYLSDGYKGHPVNLDPYGSHRRSKNRRTKKEEAHK